MLAKRVMGLQEPRSVMIIDFERAQIIPGLTHEHPQARLEAATLAGGLQWLISKWEFSTLTALHANEASRFYLLDPCLAQLSGCVLKVVVSQVMGYQRIEVKH